jgi:hypothetical protein
VEHDDQPSGARLSDTGGMRSPVPAITLLVLASSCSFQAQCGGARVDQAKTEALVKQLAEQVDTVTATRCPGDVEAKVGATFECTATFADGSTHASVVKLTHVEGNDVRADATWKTPLFGARKRAEIEHSISQTIGVAGSLDCKPGVLALVPDQKLRCTVKGPTDQAPIDIWYTTDDKINWKINPDEPPAEAPPEAR